MNRFFQKNKNRNKDRNNSKMIIEQTSVVHPKPSSSLRQLNTCMLINPGKTPAQANKCL